MPKGRKSNSVPKGPKLKAVNYRLIPEVDANGHVPEPYLLLNEVRDSHHADTLKARVALAWRLREKPDKDGHLILGKCVKCSDLSREFADYDFIIVLNKDSWDDIEFDKKKKLALLDHECCHIAPDYDNETGEHKHDERGRLLFRTRAHDIAEFTAIIVRHGVYKRDLEIFAEALLRKQNPQLFPAPDKVKKDAAAVVQ